MGWAAALFAMLASSVVAVIVINLIIAMHQGRETFLQLGEALTLGVTVTVVNSTLALLFVTVIWNRPDSAWLMVVPVAALYFAYRSAQSERSKRKSITHLFNLGRELQGSVQTDMVIRTLTNHAVEMLDADWVGLGIHACGPLLILTVAEAAGSDGDVRRPLVELSGRADVDDHRVLGRAALETERLEQETGEIIFQGGTSTLVVQPRPGGLVLRIDLGEDERRP